MTGKRFILSAEEIRRDLWPGRRAWDEADKARDGSEVMREYTLVFDGHDLGRVRQEDADFPNLWGRIELLPTVSTVPELQHVMDYVAFSVRVQPVHEQDRADEVSSEEEMTFADLIETEAWALRDESGEVHGILIPLFCPDGEIIWRWNIRGAAAEQADGRRR